MNLAQYNKLIVFVITAILTLVPAFWPDLPSWWQAIVLLAGAYGIYRVPNITIKQMSDFTRISKSIQKLIDEAKERRKPKIVQYWHKLLKRLAKMNKKS